MSHRTKLTAQHSVALGLVVAFAYAGGWFLTGAGLFAIVAYLVFENHYRLGQADALAEQGPERPGLETMARHDLWPTPTVKGNYNKKGLSPTSGDGLATAVNRRLWPTPRASENENRQTKLTPSQIEGRHGRSLAAEVNLWPTPMASDGTGGFCPPDKQPANRQGSRTLKEVTRGPLNPTWVEWLMGFPIGHTDCGDLVTPSFRRKRSGSGEGL